MTVTSRFTTPGEALAALRTKLRAAPLGPDRLYRCGVCLDTGWQEIDGDGRGTVAHCRRGCEVPVKGARRTAPSSTQGTTFA